MASPVKKHSRATVTVLFTDVVGSTQLLDRLGDDAVDHLRRKHFKRLREVVRSFEGREVKSLGDGLMVVFTSAYDAAACAIAIQQSSNDGAEALWVRVGIHSGEPIWDEKDLFGTSVVVAKRLCDQAGGGQIVVSDLVRALIGGRGDFAFNELGFLELKGFKAPVAAAEVLWRQSPSEYGLPSEVEPPEKPRRSGVLLTGIWVLALSAAAIIAAAQLARDSEGRRRQGITLGAATDPKLQSVSLDWGRRGAGWLARGPGEQMVVDLTAHQGHLFASGRDEKQGDLEAAVWIRTPAGRWSQVLADGRSGTSGDQMIFAITGRGRELVAVGADNATGDWDPAVWTSRDLGRHWRRTAVGLDEAGDEVFHSIAHSGSTYVAVGYSSDREGTAQAAIWWSRNARSWTRVEQELGAFEGLWWEARDVIAADNAFIAVGRAVTNTEDGVDAAIWRSSTGENWKPVVNPALERPQEQEILSIVRHRAGFLAAGFDSVVGDRDAALWSSSNGRRWARVPHDESALGGENDQAIYALSSGNGLVAAAGLDGRDGGLDAAIWLSLNGRKWRRMSVGEDLLGGDGIQEMRGVVIARGELVIVGGNREAGDPDAAVWSAKVIGP